jgi:hypothetical protein
MTGPDADRAAWDRDRRKEVMSAEVIRSTLRITGVLTGASMLTIGVLTGSALLVSMWS